ncbi:MAG TPA: methyltransferase domain-containing protein [Candidatus Eisenbacteria bacterium]|nr:methyltransferase domain-containing protein [Candidatus Eisenbacteria bacterium]
MSRLRSSIRWLLTPLLIVIDRRIAWRSRPLDERMLRAERELAGLQEYVRLVAGSLAPAPDTAPGETARPATPVPANGAVPVPAPQASGRVEFTDRLACPVCRSQVQVVPEIVTADGRIKRGHVPCSRCEQVVAQVRDFRVEFRARGGPIPEPAGPPRIVPAIGEIRLPFDDPRLCLNGGWTVWDGRFAVSHGSLADSLEYRGRFTDALVHLVTHVNGGVVDFFVDGRLTATADLYSDHWFVLPFTIASDLPFEEHVLRIQPRGTRNAAAKSPDVFVAELVLTGPQTDPGFEAPRPLNRGNAYIEVFERHIARVPDGELILEVGGGERRRLRRGYINLEYMTVECADVYGDIERLPFQDDTFSLVLTQAVFEHLANPHVAAAELIRVTRPGGTIVTDVAFMQPLHAAPYHYYNMTPWGAEELFKSCTIVESDHYDGLASTIEWILRSVQAHTKVSERDFADLVERVRAIEGKLSHSEIRAAASGVWVVARKPVAGSGPGQPAPAAAAAEDSIAAR